MDLGTIFPLSPEDYKQLIFTMECSVFNGEALDMAVLDQIPRRIMQESPILLEWQASHYFYKGKLQEARLAIDMAVKGFAQQTYAQKLNPALSLLAILNMKLGEIHDAETIITYLKDQWVRNPEDLDGRALMALSSGSYLIGDFDKTKEYGMAAEEVFIRQGQQHEAVHMGLELFLSQDTPMSEQESASILLFVEQQARLDSQLLPYWLAAKGTDCMLREDWDSAIRLLQQVDQQALSYQHGVKCEFNKLRGSLYKGSSLNMEEQEFIQGVLKQYGSDMFIRFEAYDLLFISAKMERQHTLASQYLNSLQAIAHITRHPRHRQWLHQEEKRESVNTVSWKIQLFNKMKFIRNGHEKQDLSWKRKKGLELLVYLLMQHQFSTTKEQVMEDLFGSLYVDKMANQLYVIVHQLKQTLKKELGFEQAVILKDGQIRLHEQLVEETDIEQYEALLREGDQIWDNQRTKAIELYKKAILMYGGLVPEVRYADWLEHYRAAFQDKQAEVLKKLAREASDQSQYELSEAYYKDWIALCPVQEQAYKGLIELYVSNSRKQDALNYYLKWESICLEEFGVDPSWDTDTFFLALMGGRP